MKYHGTDWDNYNINEFGLKSRDIINLSGEELVGCLADIKHGELYYDCVIISYNKGDKHRHYQIKNKDGRVFEKSYRHLIKLRKK